MCCRCSFVVCPFVLLVGGELVDLCMGDRRFANARTDSQRLFTIHSSLRVLHLFFLSLSHIFTHPPLILFHFGCSLLLSSKARFRLFLFCS